MPVAPGTLRLNQAAVGTSPFTTNTFTVGDDGAVLVAIWQSSFQGPPTSASLNGSSAMTQAVLANYNGNQPIMAWVLTGVAAGTHDIDFAGHPSGDNAGRVLVLEYAGVDQSDPVRDAVAAEADALGFPTAHDYDLDAEADDIVLAAMFELYGASITGAGDRDVFRGTMGYGDGLVQEYDGASPTVNVDWSAHSVEFGSFGLTLRAAAGGGGEEVEDTLEDDAEATDAVATQAVRVAAHPDDIVADDAVTTSAEVLTALPDVVEASDALLDAVELGETLSDPTEVADAATFMVERPLILMDGTEAVDAMSETMALGETMPEAVEAADGSLHAFELGESLTDQVAAEDAFVSTAERADALTDGVEAADAVAVGVESSGSLSEILEVTDSLVVEELAVGADLMTEEVTASDAAAFTGEASTSLPDVVEAADAVVDSITVGNTYPSDFAEVVDALLIEEAFGSDVLTEALTALDGMTDSFVRNIALEDVVWALDAYSGDEPGPEPFSDIRWPDVLLAFASVAQSDPILVDIFGQNIRLAGSMEHRIPSLELALISDQESELWERVVVQWSMYAGSMEDLIRAEGRIRRLFVHDLGVNIGGVIMFTEFLEGVALEAPTRDNVFGRAIRLGVEPLRAGLQRR